MNGRMHVAMIGDVYMSCDYLAVIVQDDSLSVPVGSFMSHPLGRSCLEPALPAP